MTCVKFTLFMNRHELCMRKKNLAIYSTHPPLESEAAFSNADSTVRVQQYEDTYVRSMEVTYKFKAVRRNFRPIDGSYLQVQSSTKKLPSDGWKLPTSSSSAGFETLMFLRSTCRRYSMKVDWCHVVKPQRSGCCNSMNHAK